MKSPSTRTGSFPAGFTARNSGRRCSPLGGVYVDELEFDIQLAQRPEDADRTGRREPIELHGVAVSFGPERAMVEQGVGIDEGEVPALLCGEAARRTVQRAREKLGRVYPTPAVSPPRRVAA